LNHPEKLIEGCGGGECVLKVVGSAGVRGVLADGTFTHISLRIFIGFLFFIFLFLRILNFYIIARMPGRAVFQKYIDQQKQAQNYRHKISTNLKTNSKIQMTLRRAVTTSSQAAPSLFGAALSKGL
jgi:hypothetical protein